MSHSLPPYAPLHPIAPPTLPFYFSTHQQQAPPNHFHSAPPSTEISQLWARLQTLEKAKRTDDERNQQLLHRVAELEHKVAVLNAARETSEQQLHASSVAHAHTQQQLNADSVNIAITVEQTQDLIAALYVCFTYINQLEDKQRRLEHRCLKVEAVMRVRVFADKSPTAWSMYGSNSVDVLEDLVQFREQNSKLMLRSLAPFFKYEIGLDIIECDAHVNKINIKWFSIYHDLDKKYRNAKADKRAQAVAAAAAEQQLMNS